MAAPAGRGRGRGRRGNPPHHFVWEGSFGPEEYEPPLEQFPLEGIHTFVGARRLRPYDDRREEWPKCAHGEHCVVQVFDSWIDGGRRFYRCPNGYVCVTFTVHFIQFSEFLTLLAFCRTTMTWETVALLSGLIL